MKQFIILILATLALNLRCLGASDWELFEETSVPNGWSAENGTISVSNDQFLQGNQSLSWQRSNSDSILEYSGSTWATTGYVNSFSFWIHLTNPMPEAVLKVSFYSGDTLVNWFEFNLNFTGWRTTFYPYRDMYGNGGSPANRLSFKIVGESDHSRTPIHIDQIIFEKNMDSRHQYADAQAPFVRETLDKSHWEPRVAELSRNPLSLHSPDSSRIEAAERLTESVTTALVGSGSVTDSMVENLRLEVSRYQIARGPLGISGKQIFYNSYPAMAYPATLRNNMDQQTEFHDFRVFGALQLKIARYYHRSGNIEHKSQLAELYQLMAEHLLNQGWASGSNQGCIHHIGYQIREYFEANFLMRDVLMDASLLKSTRAAMQWYSRAGQLLESEVEPNLDYYNTIAHGQLLSLLMEEDSERKAAWLMAYQSTLSETLSTVTPGDGLGLKPDGTAFHHNGHYPAYAIGAFGTLGKIFDYLWDTPFQPTPPAHIAFRKALLASRLYSQKFDWPIGIGGRHPFSGSISSLRNAFLALAKYPEPLSGRTPDPEVSGAILRLWGSISGDLGAQVNANNILPEDLEGFWSFPFAAHAVARANNWMASMKGYSRYVWSSEIYSSDNRFGRYQSNGALEIYTESGRRASGYHEPGWDWNRLPGTTIVNLPLPMLESPRSGTLMLRSNETFAGAVSLHNQVGMFAFILNETFFGNNLKARKSVTMLGDILVVLGSGISSSNNVYPTETNVFQVALSSPSEPQTFGSAQGTIDGLGKSGYVPSGKGLWFTDPLGLGYWLAPNQGLYWERKTQDSFHNKTEAPTSGDFSTAWISHYKSPLNEAYHYAIIPRATHEDLATFNSDMQNGDRAHYVVLSQTSDLHAIWHPDSSTLFVSAFENANNLKLPILKGVSNPLLASLCETAQGLTVAVSNPDLKPTETGHEISLNRLVLDGIWLPENETYTYWHTETSTHIVIPTTAGMTRQINLIPLPDKHPLNSYERNQAIASPAVTNSSNPEGTLTWDVPSINSRLGWIVERLDSATEGFVVVDVLNPDTRQWNVPSPNLNTLHAYRISDWRTTGLGSPSKPIATYQSATPYQNNIPITAILAGNPLKVSIPNSNALEIKFPTTLSPEAFGLILKSSRSSDLLDWSEPASLTPLALEPSHKSYLLSIHQDQVQFFRFFLSEESQ